MKKEIINLLRKYNYEFHNKRLLGNPEYTSEESKNKDLIQEIALIINWLIVEHKLFLTVWHNTLTNKWRVDNIWDMTDKEYYDYTGEEYDVHTEAYLEGIKKTIELLEKNRTNIASTTEM